MPANDVSEPIYYNSLYQHGVDEKRRVQIPAKWRPVQPDVQFTLILWPKGTLPEACLLVLPPEEWHNLVQKLKAMPFADPKAEALRRLLGRKSDRVTLDKAGRICLPEHMARAVGIEKDAVLVGLLDRFEIWSPSRYETASAVDDELLPEAFKLI
jgi:MraZ protein